MSAQASVVLKWPLVIDDKVQTVGGGRVVLVAMQGPTLCVWTREYEGDATGDERQVRVVGTGHLMRLGVHVGSVIDGPFVWHVFEVSS